MPANKISYLETASEQSIYFGGLTVQCGNIEPEAGIGPLLKLTPGGTGEFLEAMLKHKGAVFALQAWGASECSDPLRMWVGGSMIDPESNTAGKTSGLWAVRESGTSFEWTFPTDNMMYGIWSDALEGTVLDAVVYNGDLVVAGHFSHAGCRSYDNVARLTCKTVCRLDFDGDGFVNGNDFDAFTDAFVRGDIDADYNQDGFVTGDDIDLFSFEFEIGCS